MRLGPENASLRVYTGRVGMAAVAGHDLVLEVTRWEAAVADDSVSVDADPGSIVVREGRGGAKPLTSSDREKIRRTIADKVLGTDPIAFRSSTVERDGDRLRVRGDLTIAGAVRPIAFEADLGGPRARVTLRQTEWGIKPYTGMLGALRVRDEVEVELVSEGV